MEGLSRQSSKMIHVYTTDPSVQAFQIIDKGIRIGEAGIRYTPEVAGSRCIVLGLEVPV